MDGGDASLAIRRARRSGAKRLDLSRRGLAAWPEDLFALQQLEALDLSGNELSAVDKTIVQLENLAELDLSGNRLRGLPELGAVAAGLPQLRSLALDGNPVALRLGPAAVRQLLHPPPTPGLTPAQVICDVLRQGGGEEDPPLGGAVRDLRGEQESPEARQGGLGGSGLPSWLQQDPRANLASTLPSRRGGLADGDEVADLRQQLREEQRKNKRLEQQVQKLSDRAQEREMTRGGAGSAPHFEWSAREVELGEIINQGGFSVVHKGFWHGTKVAIKKLFDPKITDELLAEFDNEVQKLEQIRHPNILMLLAVHRKPPALAIITELVEGGSMFQLLHKPAEINSASGPISAATLKEALDILEVTAGAIAFLHARGIVHRDVKSHNVLLSPSMEVKLCDFGLARMRSELMTGAMQFAGTPNYMAPEIFRNQKYTESVDVFAFGTLLWEAAAGDIPWANMDPPDIRERVLDGQMLPIPRSVPHELQALIQDCWTAERNSRPPMAAVVSALRTCPRDGSARSNRPHTAVSARDAVARSSGSVASTAGATRLSGNPGAF